MLRTGCEMTPFLAQLHRACIGLASTSDRGPIGLTSEVETAGDIAAELGDRCTPVVAHHTHHIRKTAELHNSIYMCGSLPIARAFSPLKALLASRRLLSSGTPSPLPSSSPNSSKSISPHILYPDSSICFSLHLFPSSSSSLSSRAQVAPLPARTPHTFLFFPIILLSLPS